MSMQVSVRSSDQASGGKALPWPVLAAGNTSFPKGVYTVSLTHREHGRSFELKHSVEGAGLIVEWMKTDKVRYLCAVAAPVSAYRHVHVSTSPTQVIHWDPDDLGSYPVFTPMIASASEMRHVVDTEKDGLDPLWHGRTLSLSKGSRVAICWTFALQSGLLGLLDFRLADDYAAGQFNVEPSQADGFKFKVHLAKDLFDYLQHRRRDPNGKNIMTHIVSAALGHLKRDYRSDDDDEGWKSYRNLVAFAAVLEEKGLAHWSDEEFQPERAATSLYPHVLSESGG